MVNTINVERLRVNLGERSAADLRALPLRIDDVEARLFYRGQRVKGIDRNRFDRLEKGQQIAREVRAEVFKEAIARENVAK